MSDDLRPAVVVEDDPDIRSLLGTLLRQAGFSVTEAENGLDGVAAVRQSDPDLVTIDLNLPDIDGIEVCRRVRDASEAYIVMLTARHDEVDRLIGLETGADDYLTKPFSPREFKARVAALMRRPRRLGAPVAAVPAVPAAAAPAALPAEAPSDGNLLRHGDLEMEVDARVVSLEGKELDLTRTEFDLLAALMLNPRRVWTREALFQSVWRSDWVGDSHLVEVHIGNLRRKLGDGPQQARYVRTVRGVGYRLGSG